MSVALDLQPALELVCDEFRKGFALPPRYTVSEWADTSRILPRETTSAHGKWNTDRVPFAREIMDSLSTHERVPVVVLMKGSQIAGTEIELNWIGYSIEHDPSSILLLLPDFGFARKFSKRRVQAMINASPTLSALVARSRSRDSGNTHFQKDFRGGSLIIASANSAASVSSDPLRRVVGDEVDRWPRDVDKEGSPLWMALARMTAFPDRKAYFNSTPGLKETSQIEPLFLQGDMRRYYVPCPECGEMDFLTWRGVDPFGRVDGDHFRIHMDDERPETACLFCPRCGALSEEHHKTRMFAAGEWRPTAPGDGETRSYHLPSFYSPYGWLSWSSIGRQFLHAMKDVKRGAYESLQVVVNTRFGETFEDPGQKVEARGLLERAETWPAPPPEGVGAMVPDGVGVITASVDTQGNRLELLVQGWGAGEESWVLDYRQIHGDPDEEEVWRELDERLQRTWRHQSGREMPILCTVVDAMGNKSESVYGFCAPREGRRVFAIRGGQEMGRPLVGNPTRNNRYRAPLFTLCTDTGKDRVFSRLQITRGPGCYHFPKLHWFDEEFVAQLTSEKKLLKHKPGRGWVPEWKKLRDRNEALDLCVYNLAALYILGRDFVDALAEEAERWARPLEDGEVTGQAAPEVNVDAAAAPSQAPGWTPGRAGWLNSWRGR